jgi:hypothetical protein
MGSWGREKSIIMGERKSAEMFKLWGRVPSS